MSAFVLPIFLFSLTLLTTRTAQMTLREAMRLPVCTGHCTCGSEYFPGQKVMLAVTCGQSDLVAEVPDWSDLARVRANISITLNLDKFPRLFRLSREDFPVGIQVKVVRLNHLNPGHNISDDVFENLRYSLTAVDLGGYIDGPLMLLANLPSLESLVLHIDDSKDWSAKQDLAIFSQSLFRGVGLAHLSSLELFGGKISELGPEIFDGLSAQRIDLYLNNLRQFPGAALRKVKHLKVLFVYENQITHLKDEALNGMVLEKLDFPNSRLKNIGQEAFVGVRDTLTDLYIRGGNLRELPTTALSPLKQLKVCSFVDMEGDEAVNVSKSFLGNYCLEKLFVSFKNLDLHPDAFQGQEDCIRELYIKSASLEAIPTKALATLRKIQVFEVQSRALSTLPARTFSGFHGKRLVIEAPLTEIQTGAFLGLVRYPVVLHLEGARLKSLDFFFQYPGNTFSSIGLGNTEVLCDCQLAGVNLNLERFNYSVGGYLVPGYVSGECVLGEEQMGTYYPQVRDLFRQCKNLTILEPRIQPSSRAGFAASPSMASVLISLLAIRTWTNS